MPVKFTTAASPYEILVGLLCEPDSIYHSAERSYHHHHLTGDTTYYRTFSFGTGFEQSDPWRVLNRLSGSPILTGKDLGWSSPPVEGSSAIAVYETHPLSSARPGPLRHFCVIPPPERELDELVFRFLTEPIPPVSVGIGYLVSRRPGEHVMDIQDLDPADIEVSSMRFSWPPVDANDHSYRLLALHPLLFLRIAYPSRLDLLWEFPTSGFNLSQIIQDGAEVVVLKFEHPERPSVLVLKYTDTTRDSDACVHRNRALFADVIAMHSALMGYTALAEHELAFLILLWWSVAGGQYAGLLSAAACRRTSVLLLSDMMRRIGDHTMLEPLLERAMKRRQKLFDSTVITELGTPNPRMYLFPVPTSVTSLDHHLLLKIWNLLRSQLGHEPVRKHNYLEVAHNAG
jgi:hypothetical protein